jgi:hypothetical protein
MLRRTDNYERSEPFNPTQCEPDPKTAKRALRAWLIAECPVCFFALRRDEQCAVLKGTLVLKGMITSGMYWARKD